MAPPPPTAAAITSVHLGENARAIPSNSGTRAFAIGDAAAVLEGRETLVQLGE